MNILLSHFNTVQLANDIQGLRLRKDTFRSIANELTEAGYSISVPTVNRICTGNNCDVVTAIAMIAWMNSRIVNIDDHKKMDDYVE